MIARVIASAMVLTAVATLAASSTETTRLEMAGITTLEARTFNGFVKLQVGSDAAMLKTVKLGAATINVTRRDATLLIEAKAVMPAMPNSRVDLELRIPAGLTVTLVTGNGKVESHGAVKVVRAEVGNGEVLIEDARNATINARSGNGGVIVRSSSGRVEVSSGNGGVSLETFSFTPGSRSLMRSGNGSLSVLALSAPGGLQINGSSRTGRLNLCLPAFDLKTEKMVVGGRFTAIRAGSNPATLELTASNGNIVVNPSLLIGSCNQ